MSAHPASLRWRLLAATVVGLATALLVAAVVLQGVFRAEVLRQFESDLTAQLDQLTARLEVDERAQLQVMPPGLSDPRAARPNSGLYWQVEPLLPVGHPGAVEASAAAAAPAQAGSAPSAPHPLRSRSLWDHTLQVPRDLPADGTVHRHQVAGPAGGKLMVLERVVRLEAATGELPVRVLVAADLAPFRDSVQRFRGALAASLGALLLLLGAAAWAQVRVGLKPLRTLATMLQRVRSGAAPTLEGQFPGELQPLVDDFNAVLHRQAESLERARTQAGNLAHAIKTPLTLLDQAAQRSPQGGVPAPLVREQVQAARRHVDWHLARARAAAAAGVKGLAGARTELAPMVDGLLRVMRLLRPTERRTDPMAGTAAEAPLAERPPLDYRAEIPAGLAFAGELQDAQEMLGNLLENAAKWARTQVRVQAALEAARPGEAAWLRIHVRDDGPGIPAAQRAQALQRGQRLDESTPGTGLGLAIVDDLARQYGGQLLLEEAPEGGLDAVLRLPAA